MKRNAHVVAIKHNAHVTARGPAAEYRQPVTRAMVGGGSHP